MPLLPAATRFTQTFTADPDATHEGGRIAFTFTYTVVKKPVTTENVRIVADKPDGTFAPIPTSEFLQDDRYRANVPYGYKLDPAAKPAITFDKPDGGRMSEETIDLLPSGYFFVVSYPLIIANGNFVDAAPTGKVIYIEYKITKSKAQEEPKQEIVVSWRDDIRVTANTTFLDFVRLGEYTGYGGQNGWSTSLTLDEKILPLGYTNLTFVSVQTGHVGEGSPQTVYNSFEDFRSHFTTYNNVITFTAKGFLDSANYEGAPTIQFTFGSFIYEAQR